MQKPCFLSALLVLLLAHMTGCGPSSRQVRIAEDVLVPFRAKEAGNWGFIDVEGEVKIEPDFERKPSLMVHGFAYYPSGHDTYQYINREGKVLDPEYLAVSFFNEGLAAVIPRKTGVITVINEDFETVFTLPQAVTISHFSQGMAFFQNFNGKYGFVNQVGEMVVPPTYDILRVLHEDRAIFGRLEVDGVSFGFLDATGQEVIPADDDILQIRDFSGGLAAFMTDNGWGFMNREGEVVIEEDDTYQLVTNFMGGYASMKQGNEWGVIDPKGEKVIRSKYNFPVVFVNDLALMGRGGKSDHVGIIDQAGNTILESKYDGVAVPFLGDHAIVQDGNDYVLIDREGEENREVEFAEVSSDLISLITTQKAFDLDAELHARFVSDEALIGSLFEIDQGKLIIGEVTTGQDVATVAKATGVAVKNLSTSRRYRTITRTIEGSDTDGIAARLQITMSEAPKVRSESSGEDEINPEAVVESMQLTISYDQAKIEAFEDPALYLQEVENRLRALLSQVGKPEADDPDQYRLPGGQLAELRMGYRGELLRLDLEAAPVPEPADL